MGGGSSRSSKARSERIDRQLEAEALQFKREASVLLFGSDEASNTALVKHMKVVHGRFSTQELAAFRSAIHRTVIDAAQAVVFALQKSGLDGMLAEKQRLLCANLADALSRETADAIDVLWPTPAVTRVLEDQHTSELNLPDSATYFFSNIQSLAQPGYIPTEEDIMRTPAQKNAITETRLTMGPLSIRIIDVGPLRFERKKWILYLERATSIIFCTALSDYDQVLTEERGQNRMRESLALFSSIINSRWFLCTSIILFLTEIDDFKAKISKSPISAHFPEYSGGADINKAAKYILWRFMQENRVRLTVYPHLARTTDVQNVQVVFTAVKETILQNAIKDSGIPSRVARASGLL
ncbi:G-protein alpha subunit [Mycena sanguinolenta]|nr:G-protein alpha subunit [Mycena sanguinolenta]